MRALKAAFASATDSSCKKCHCGVYFDVCALPGCLCDHSAQEVRHSQAPLSSFVRPTCCVWICCDAQAVSCLYDSYNTVQSSGKVRHGRPEHLLTLPVNLNLFVLHITDVPHVLPAARLNLPIKWLPDRIAEQNFNLEEPPTKASAWVGALLNNHLKVFRERLSTMPMLSPSDVDQVYLRHTIGKTDFMLPES